MTEYTGVVDRFEEDQAVVLLERDGSVVGDVVLDRDRLPSDARRVDAVLTVRVEDDRVVELTHRPDETEDRKESAQDRFDRLSSRPPDEEDADEP
ncbi:DUF3006 domain-containing protein [Halostella sp. JP-L12]|uniref:DUF3006 domain-containing protein n=1 Tax=Halostella TaxID=1843185 RepID=UPI000EF81C41|nr:MULTISPECIES: DUF3006 domain-containing protein [Halostella]NHN48647.1 DUF3006 domain-containing protein [Halostella sp. JP-L12]